jgi:hypothetical protein
MKFKPKEKLTKDTVLSKVDDYNIFRFYLGQDFDFKKRYSSPFRTKGVDNNPNLRFFPGDHDNILFKDFANGIGGDCFKFVQNLFGINYNDALVKIDEDLGLGIQSNKEPRFKIQLTKKPEALVKQDKLIQIIPKPFTKEELKYWEQFYINQTDLFQKGVHSIHRLYINKQLIPNYNNELRFAYLFKDYLKIYSPMSKDFKWISSCPNDFISGFDDIMHKVMNGYQDNKLIISKSVKDELVLKKFFRDVCSTQNESSASINEDNMKIILQGYAPENVFIAYDNDEPGVRASKYYTDTYGFRYINVPKIYRREGIKDWADLVSKKDLDTMKNYLKIKKLI